MMKRIANIILCFWILSFWVVGCGNSQKDVEKQPKLNVAYQYGLAYAPLMVAQEKGYIEKAYKEATGLDLEIVWTQMSSGADISTGITSGSLDAGFMGVAPAITGTLKNAGFKIFTNLSGQEHGLMTNDIQIKSLKDLIDNNKQIALVNIGSIQHIILAKALCDEGLEAHALDSHIVAMKHPDGMTALQSGSVKCHLTTSPYIYMEREEEYSEIPIVSAAWPKENSFIVGVASEKLYNDKQDIYKALCQGIEEAVNYINFNIEEAAEITHQYNGNSVEKEIEYLQNGKYMIETKGLYEMAVFMYENDFIKNQVNDYNDLVFDNVNGN